MIPAEHFSMQSLQNGIFDGTLTAGAIEGEPSCGFSSPVASALKPFFKSALILRAFIHAIHWVTEPAPLDNNRNISFLYWKLVLLRPKNAQHDILGIHDYP